MKHRYTFYVAIALCLFTSRITAQSMDISVVSVHLSSDSAYIPPGITSSMAITLFNEDTAAIEAGDTIEVGIEIDGTFYLDEILLTNPLLGMTELYHNLGAANLHAFHDTNTVHTVTAFVNYAGDTNALNNYLVANYITDSAVVNDWSCAGVNIVSPSNLDGFDIDNGTNTPPAIAQAQVELKNTGNVRYLQWTRVHYTLFLGEDSTAVQGVLNLGDVPPDSSTVRVINNQSLFPAVPDSVGTYSFCAEANEFYDMASSNDVGCYTFSIVDNYDPEDPVNWPHGIEGTPETAPFRLVASHDHLEVHEFTNPMQLHIYDMRGALVAEQWIESSTAIATHSLGSGIFVVHMEDDAGQVWVQKFVQP